MTRTAREFQGEQRSTRLVGMLMATALFGPLTVALWIWSADEKQLQVLALAFSVGCVVLVVSLVAAAINAGTTAVRVVMIPARPTLGEPVEFRWSLPDEAAPLKTLEIILEESKQGRRQEPGKRGDRRPVKRHSIARVHGQDTVEGEATYLLPDRDNTRLADYEIRTFELVVRGKSGRGAGPRDRYSLGEFGSLDD